MEESGRTTAARTPLVPTSTANTLTLISSRYPLGQPFLDGGNATIRGGEGHGPECRASHGRQYHASMGLQSLPAGAGPDDQGTKNPAMQDQPSAAPGHRRHLAVIGLVVLGALGAGFVAYAVNVSRTVPSSKYANLVVYASPAKAPSFDLARLGGPRPLDLGRARGTDRRS